MPRIDAKGLSLDLLQGTEPRHGLHSTLRFVDHIFLIWSKLNFNEWTLFHLKMPRARTTKLKAEAEELPVRSTSRKRKLVEYAEAESGEEALDGGVSAEEDLADHANGSVTTKGRRKSQKQPASKASTPAKAGTPRRGKAKVKAETVVVDEVHTTNANIEEINGVVEEEQQAIVETTTTPSKSKSKSKAKPISKSKVKSQDTQALDPELSGESASEATTKPKRKRKTKEEKEAEAMPLASRTANLRMFVGAHTSIAKGVENAITNCIHIGGNAFACFLKSQRKWDNPSLKAENRDMFRSHLLEHKYDATKHIVPHGSYLVNLASADPNMAKKSYDVFLDDLQRCEELGIKHYNFHPGAAGQAPLDEAIARLANNLNKALAATKTVVPLLENMATRGSIIGGRFSDLSAVIKLIKPEFQSRIGVCIDTCHAFASGYDLRTPETFAATLSEFDDTVGMKYLKALHINDSKAPFGSNKDLHQNIGLGFLGLRAFHNVMNESRFQDLPLILETPCERPDPKDPTGKKTFEDRNVWATEVKLLESLIGMDADSDEFMKMEKELSDKGKAERIKVQKQIDDVAEKKRKKLEREKEKGQRSLKDMFGGGGKKGGKKKESSSESELSELEERTQ